MTTSLRRIWITAGLITALVIVIVMLLPKSKQFMVVGELQGPAPDLLASTLLRTGANWFTQTTYNLFTNN